MTGLRDGGRVVLTDNGEVQNEGLIIASGGRRMKRLPGIEHAITLCEGIEAAERIRDAIETLQGGGAIALGFGGNPNEPAAVRGGPMFELMLELDTLLRRQGRRDRFKLVFFNPAARPGNRLGEAAVDALLRRRAKLGIETHLGHKPLRFEADKVVPEGGEFAADLILFMPGMTGPAWLEGCRCRPAAWSRPMPTAAWPASTRCTWRATPAATRGRTGAQAGSYGGSAGGRGRSQPAVRAAVRAG